MVASIFCHDSKSAFRCKNEILLKTATVLAENENGLKTMPVCLLLDDGSQKSYIQNHVRTELNLQTIKTQNVYLNTFGDEKYNKQKLDVVKLKLKDRFNGYSTEVEITAMCVPSICSPLPSSIDISQFPHLERYELVDNYTDSHNYQERPIDILIGPDQYYKIVTGDIISLKLKEVRQLSAQFLDICFVV